MQNSQNINTPLISFIVTYHNEPIQLLKECLDSIFELSLSDEEREIILVDDGSDESPLNEIVEYRDKINYLRQPHMGVCTGRNNGITLSRGTYLQFIDADDCLITNSYEHCLDIVRYKNPDMGLFNFTTEGTDVDTPYLFNGPLSGTEYMRHNKTGLPNIHPSNAALFHQAQNLSASSSYCNKMQHFPFLSKSDHQASNLKCCSHQHPMKEPGVSMFFLCFSGRNSYSFLGLRYIWNRVRPVFLMHM